MKANERGYRYELFGGPMDGAVISSKVEVDEGHCITLDLCLKEALPGEAEILTKPCRSQAVHQMLDGKLIYLGTKTLT